MSVHRPFRVFQLGAAVPLLAIVLTASGSQPPPEAVSPPAAPGRPGDPPPPGAPGQPPPDADRGPGRGRRDALSQEDVDGGLVGGASLKSESFLKLIEIAGKML